VILPAPALIRPWSSAQSVCCARLPDARTPNAQGVRLPRYSGHHRRGCLSNGDTPEIFSAWTPRRLLKNLGCSTSPWSKLPPSLLLIFRGQLKRVPFLLSLSLSHSFAREPICGSYHWLFCLVLKHHVAALIKFSSYQIDLVIIRLIELSLQHWAAPCSNHVVLILHTNQVPSAGGRARKNI